LEPEPAPGTPPRTGALAAIRRYGPRVVFLVAGLGALAMRPVVVRNAEPTRQALRLVKRSDEVCAELGSPLRLGWNVGGEIHGSASVNDVDVPPRLDATVSLLGPKGEGVLTIVGRDDDVAWTFQRVSVEFEDGRRIDLVGTPPPPEEPWWRLSYETMRWLAIVGGGLTVLFLVVGGLSYRVSIHRAVARADAPAGVPFELGFRAASREHRVVLAFEVEHPGDADDEGITARLEIRSAGRAPASIEHRIGRHVPAIGREFTESTARYTVSISASGGHATTSATVVLATIPRTKGDVVVAGTLHLAEGQTANKLLVYVVPR
jgi:hypothetical protein